MPFYVVSFSVLENLEMSEIFILENFLCYVKN